MTDREREARDEGVTIETATSLEEATSKAARLALRGPRGETPVLALAPPPDTGG